MFNISEEYMDDFHFYKDLPMGVKGGDPVPQNIMKVIPAQNGKRNIKYS